MNEPGQTADSIIEVRDLVRKFDGFTAVDHISFDVERGDIFAFLGPNGAGKTTTIKMLTTLLVPTSGQIKLNGVDAVHDAENARCVFGIVFQDPSLDDELTANENMELHAILYSIARREAKQRIEDLLKLVDLWDRRNDYVKTYSGGMKRRLEIARGFLHHPKILFLDEPTLGLDPQTRNYIWDYVRRLNEEESITVFFTTHNMEEAERIARKVAIIDHGHIITQGSPAELKAQTNTETLEDAFLALTGRALREETASGIDQMRMRRRMFGGGRR